MWLFWKFKFKSFEPTRRRRELGHLPNFMLGWIVRLIIRMACRPARLGQTHGRMAIRIKVQRFTMEFALHSAVIWFIDSSHHLMTCCLLRFRFKSKIIKAHHSEQDDFGQHFKTYRNETKWKGLTGKHLRFNRRRRLLRQLTASTKSPLAFV